LWRFCAVGFFRRDKGLEQTLNALVLLKKRGVSFEFVIAGSSQPQFAGQDAYVAEVRTLIDQLQLADSVHVNRAFLSRAEQIELIQASHAGIFSYQDPDQSSSGTVPLVLAVGRPVICTPYEFAVAKRRELGDGVFLSDGFGADDIAEALSQFIVRKAHYAQTAIALYSKTRLWAWSEVGELYARAFHNAGTPV
jgi:glycosyltransferase involved in cell wall biosynthesis